METPDQNHVTKEPQKADCHPRLVLGSSDPECPHCFVGMVLDEHTARRARAIGQCIACKGTGKVNAMEKALEEISKQHLADEMDDHTSEHADWQGGYEAIVKIARTALSSGNDKGI